MDEAVAAGCVLTQPITKIIDALVRDPSLKLSHFVVDFCCRYLVDSDVGHGFMKAVAGPGLSYLLSRLYENRKIMRHFEKSPDWSKTVLVGATSFLNFELFTKPVHQLVANLAIVYCDVAHGPESREDAFMFFNLGQMGPDGVIGSTLGSGDSNDPSNCFFPGALSHGVRLTNSSESTKCRELQEQLSHLSWTNKFVEVPLNAHDIDKMNLLVEPLELSPTEGEVSEVSDFDDFEIIEEELNQEMKSTHQLYRYGSSETLAESIGTVSAQNKHLQEMRIKISMSCLLFSVLCYRDNDELKRLSNVSFLPGIKHYTAETGSSCTEMIIWVDEKSHFAVVSYRGTQFEVIRELLTSLDFTLEPFKSQTGSSKETSNAGFDGHVRKVYMDEVVKSAELCLLEQPFEGEHVSPLDLISTLSQRGYKIYCTGHSLGGGLATLLASKLAAENVNFEGLITFGATPVGDKEFVRWFKQTVKCSWRFVYGDEFAPLTPPIPFISPEEGAKLVHIGELIHLQEQHRRNPETVQEIEERLGELAGETGLLKTIVEHNPFLTLRALRKILRESSKFCLPVQD